MTDYLIPFRHLRTAGTWPRTFAKARGETSNALFHARDILWRNNAKKPLVLAYMPLSRGLPFQSALYSRCLAHDAFAFPVDSLDYLEGSDVVCHLHWLGNVLEQHVKFDTAEIELRVFLFSIDQAKDRGVRFVWTCHNVLPHQTRFRELEIALRQGVIDRCEAVHTMSETTIESTKELFTIPEEKAFQSPMPTFHRYYPNTVTREQARFSLDLKPDSRVFLLFGRMDENKGSIDFTKAFKQVRDEIEKPLELLIAGPPMDPSVVRDLVELADGDRDIQVFPRFVAPEEVQYFFNACDFVACPYTQCLNSAMGTLAATFVRPILAPRLGGLRKLLKEGAGFGYHPETPLEDVIRLALKRISPRLNIDLGRWPYHASDTFFEGLRRFV